jgi:hypothetical protein
MKEATILVHQSAWRKKNRPLQTVCRSVEARMGRDRDVIKGYGFLNPDFTVNLRVFPPILDEKLEEAYWENRRISLTPTIAEILCYLLQEIAY